MNFSVAVKDFAQALGRIASATPQRSPMPVLENVLLELEGSTLSLTATDMDITVTTTLEVRGTSNGSILVPAAENGNVAARFALAETFDPNMLAAWGTREPFADVVTARSLYSQSLAAGETRAARRLEALSQHP